MRCGAYSMRISFLRKMILVDGAKLRAFVSGTQMQAIAGTEISRRSTPITPSGFEHTIDTEQGFRWTVREPESIVSGFQLAISTKGIREFGDPNYVQHFPQCDFPGTVDLNGVRLTDESTEKDLMAGRKWIVVPHGGGCAYETPEHNVYFHFEPHPGGPPFKGVTAKLVCIQIVFLRAHLYRVLSSA